MSLAISLAYPVADLVLIGVAMGLLTTPGARTVSFRLLAASLGLLLVADQIYALQNLEGSYVSGSWIDSLYLVAYLLFGAAAAHPSMRVLTEPHPVPVTWLGPVRMVCLAAAMVTGPLLVALGPGRSRRAGGRRGRDRAPVAARPGSAGRSRRRARPRRGPATRPGGAAQLPGLPRSIDRPDQPPPLRRGGRGGARHAHRDRLGGRPVPRPRRLQDGQRQPRSCGRRCAAHRGRRPPARRPAGHGSRGTARRRRVRGPADRHPRCGVRQSRSPSACWPDWSSRSRSPA